MIYISHRGNIFGRIPELENRPKYIKRASSLGFFVEVDVWYYFGNFYLGHDLPKYKIKKRFLKNNNLLCHAKNKDALIKMSKISKVSYFWHDKDEHVLTSNKWILSHSETEDNSDTICMLPEKKLLFPKKIEKCFGVCSDYIGVYRDVFEKN